MPPFYFIEVLDPSDQEDNALSSTEEKDNPELVPTTTANKEATKGGQTTPQNEEEQEGAEELGKESDKGPSSSVGYAVVGLQYRKGNDPNSTTAGEPTTLVAHSENKTKISAEQRVSGTAQYKTAERGDKNDEDDPKSHNGQEGVED